MMYTKTKELCNQSSIDIDTLTRPIDLRYELQYIAFEYNVFNMHFFASINCAIYVCLLYFIGLKYLFPTNHVVDTSPDLIQRNVPNFNEEIIPRNIIQTSAYDYDGWFTVDSFKQQNPNHSYLFYNDTTAAEFVRKHMPPDIIRTYQSMPMAILKADYFRYISIYKLGGVYSDIDTECLRPIDTWTDQHVNVSFIVGIEAESPTWKRDYARPLQLCQWTFAATANHPILKRIIENIAKRTKKFHHRKPSISLVMDWTGPGIWTDTIFNYINETYHVEWPTLSKLEHGQLIGDIYILPITAFQPNGFDMGAKGENDVEARTKHHFFGNWKQKLFKKKIIRPSISSADDEDDNMN